MMHGNSNIKFVKTFLTHTF